MSSLFSSSTSLMSFPVWCPAMDTAIGKRKRDHAGAERKHLLWTDEGPPKDSYEIFDLFPPEAVNYK